jgi:anti-sigma B factor antagonist
MQEVTLTATEPELVFALSGEIVSENAEDFYAEVAGVYERDPKGVVFSCEKLEFIDSTTLGTFVKILKKLKADGNAFRIRGLQPRLKKLFVICALDRIMEIEA